MQDTYNIGLRTNTVIAFCRAEFISPLLADQEQRGSGSPQQSCSKMFIVDNHPVGLEHLAKWKVQHSPKTLG